MIRARYFSLLCIFGFTALVGWFLHSYFFDLSAPTLVITGVSDNKYYAGDINCAIVANKKGSIALRLDSAPLAEPFSSSANNPYNFVIPTKTMQNGPHTLWAQIHDSTFNHNKTTIECPFYVDNMPLQVVLVKHDDLYKVLQGRTLHIQIQANKEIEKATATLFSHEYTFHPESKKSLIYEAFIPIECEQTPNEYLLHIAVTDKVGNTAAIDSKMQVVMYPFKKTTMVVSDEKMKEEEKLGVDQQRFETEMERIVRNSPQEKLWRGTFCAPMDIARVTCDFGTIRTTQQKGRYAHRALDVVNAPGSVIWAPQDGIVVMKERFAYNGNTVVIDHGLGVTSMFCHLENFAKINVGDRIAQGNPIGTMGKTGYATGYHLHWEMRINGVPIDPMQWTKPTF